jgi:two-component system sensor histidine kinase ChvG
VPLPPLQGRPRRRRCWASGSASGSPASSPASTAFPEYVERAVPDGARLPEAAERLRGFNASAVRVAPDGMLILSAAVPVQRYKQVLGALMLTRDNRAIAASLREVRYDMMVIAAAALGITVLLSLYLAGTITQPIVRLARAADEGAAGAREGRPEIPTSAGVATKSAISTTRCAR